MDQLSVIERAAIVQVLLEELDDLAEYAEGIGFQESSPLADLERLARAISQLFEDADVDAAARDIPWNDYDLREDRPPWRSGGTMRMRRTDNNLAIDLSQPRYRNSLEVSLTHDPSGELAISLPLLGHHFELRVNSFVDSWRHYLRYVPAAVACCGEDGLRFLSIDEVVKIAGIKRKKLVKWNLSGPLNPIGPDFYYDPIEVARFLSGVQQ